MHSHQKQTNLQQAREVPLKVCKTKASFSADLRSPCHKHLPARRSDTHTHHAEHHHQRPSISTHYLRQAQTEGAHKMEICTPLQEG